MKNKWFTYFLGLLVLIVWGLIFYKIIYSEDSRNAKDYSTGHLSFKEILNDYSTSDTLHLSLNYSDPFRISRNYANSVGKEVITQNIRPSVVRKQVLQNKVIIYSGYVKNSGSSKFLSVLSVDGRDAIMHEGDTFEEVKLLKNYVDSIKILSNGKISYIKLQ